MNTLKEVLCLISSKVLEMALYLAPLFVFLYLS